MDGRLANIFLTIRGKYMYRDTREAEAERLAETGARRIEAAVLENLKE